MQTFILSAGLGTRLLPITNYIPKPLLPIYKDTPLLKFILQNLKNNGSNNFVINCHHKQEQFTEFKERYYAEDKSIQLVYENDILNTAGGLANAKQYLTSENFLLHNGDIFAKPPIKKFLDFHEGKKSISTLLLGKRGRKSVTPIEMNCDGLIMSIGKVCRKGYKRKNKREYFYTGIQFLRNDAFSWLPEGNKESLTELLLYKWLEEDVPFYGFQYDGVWSDIGNPQAYLNLNFLLNKTKGCLDYSGNSIINEGVRLNKVIILQDTHIETNLNNKIVLSPHVSEPEKHTIII